MAQLQACSGLLRAPISVIRQQHMVACAFKPASRCKPVLQHSQLAKTAHVKISPHPAEKHGSIVGLIMPALPLWPLLQAGAAFAEDATQLVSDADAVYAAAAAADGGTTDILVTGLAGVVFVLLLLVTGGVAYLNLSSWLDDRQEKQDREAPTLTSSASVSVSAADAEQELKKRVRVKREKRGFGGN